MGTDVPLPGNPQPFIDPPPLGVLITGANGFVGRHLIANLCARNPLPHMHLEITAAVLPHEVERWSVEPEATFGLAGWNGGTAGGRVSVVGMDLTDRASVEQVVGPTKPTWIFHLAARSSGADTDRDAVFKTNVEGTRYLLEVGCRNAGRVLLVSTGYVYGNTDAARPAVEDDPIGPAGRYGAYADSKIAMEALAGEYPNKVVVVRSFAHTGPGQVPTFALPGFAHQIVKLEKEGVSGGELRVGNLSAYRDILDVRDVVRAYVALVTSKTVSGQWDWTGVKGRTFNVSTGSPVKLHSVVEQMCALSSVKPEIVVDPSRLRPVDIDCSTGDSGRLREVVGWTPKISLDQTLQDLLDYWRAQPL